MSLKGDLVNKTLEDYDLGYRIFLFNNKHLEPESTQEQLDDSMEKVDYNEIDFKMSNLFPRSKFKN